MRATRTRAATAVAMVTALAFVVAGCGDTTNTLKANSGAIYLDLNQLKYQVQISRELNPHDPEDANYLVGLAPAQRGLGADEAWFGVFISVYNRSNQAHLAAADFTVRDTQSHVYRPISLATINPFAYRQRSVGTHDQIPRAGSVAYYASSGGSLLLFKVKLSSFDNRPLELRIANPLDPSQQASEPLDL